MVQQELKRKGVTLPRGVANSIEGTDQMARVLASIRRWRVSDHLVGNRCAAQLESSPLATASDK